MSAPSHWPAVPRSYRSLPGWAELDGFAQATFEARLHTLWPDLARPVTELYADREDLPVVLDRLVTVVARAYLDRAEDLRVLDQRRLSQPDWFQRHDMVGYVCYTDRFSGSFATLPSRLDYLAEQGVTYLHLMPVLAPREGPNDGGYAVVDYRETDPRLGSMAELRDLATTLRGRGISLVVDLVCNHTAREHEWARRAVAGETAEDLAYRDYYFFYPDRTMPDQWEQSLPEVFPDFAPGSFTWVPEADAWVWTTFNDYQWDLDYTNPRVLEEMLDVICHLGNAGVEVVRLDAVAFMWKRLGTTCQNQPEAHLILQAFRAFTRLAMPGVVLLAEAIVSPEDLVPYLGQGAATGRECELAYHNVYMVGLWSALAEGDARLLTHTLRSMPPIPPSVAWLTYSRLHDDIGWAVTDANAAAVGLDGFAHRSFLSDFYSGAHPGSWAEGEVFQENPVTRDRRISGTLASLAGLERARQRGDGEAVGLAIRRILLLHGLVLVHGGVPLIYMGDELGMLNDRSYLADPARAEDNRWVHRPAMDWLAAERRHDPTAVEARVFEGLQQLVRARQGLPQLHAQTPVEALDLGGDDVFALLRTGPRGHCLALANLTDAPRHVSLHGFDRFGPLSGLRDAITGDDLWWDFTLEPYQQRWVVPAP
ncbi:amylosucrase [Arsenicicoccus sp. oral taxon 190]|uniref:amylosucrase n=1 Tax=Arsenicicoccus sp. oral taxon 190 TaxID=1658671 RepID=UPI0012E112F5|nr:amylosucrase [Arsenicicoccus sp. oral taxon 190]